MWPDSDNYACIKFKIATLTSKALETGLSLPCPAATSVCSASNKLLQVPRTNLRFRSPFFRVSVPTLWKSLRHSVRSCESPTTFRKHLKTFYVQAHSLAPPSNKRLRFHSWFWCFTNSFTYL